MIGMYKDYVTLWVDIDKTAISMLERSRRLCDI